MYEVTIVSSEGWVCCGSSETPEEAFAAAMCAAQEAANAIQAAVGSPASTSDDRVSVLIQELPEDVRNNVKLITVLEELSINNNNADLYRTSKHRKDFLIQEIRKG